MANTVQYVVSKGFNKNIFIERDEAGINEYDVSKFGMEFFPGNEVLVPSAPDVPPAPVVNPYLTFSSEEPFILSVSQIGWDGTLEYSTDTESWNEWDGTGIESSLKNEVYLRGTDNTKIIKFTEGEIQDPIPWVLIGESISCVGNIENLLDYQTVANGEHPTMSDFCFAGMFFNCTSLTTAPTLPAITLAKNCYSGMFFGCTSLIIAPELPATTLANYCYAGMFQSCTSLVTPPQLPATTLAEGCYYGMFDGCTSLTTAPQLPATTLATGCYASMFQSCTSLTTTPELPAATLAESCYLSMFGRCTSLTTAPELHATTLAEDCYDDMFGGCIALMTVPQLPAITLTLGCYVSMFYGCSLIKLSEIQTADYTTSYRIPTEGGGVDADGALSHMFSITGGTFTGTPTINKTYYLHKDNSIV